MGDAGPIPQPIPDRRINNYDIFTDLQKITSPKSAFDNQ